MGPSARVASRRRSVRFGLFVAALAIVIGACSGGEPTDESSVAGVRIDGITYGSDQCPLIGLDDLARTFSQLGQPTESMATGGPQIVCSFANVDDPAYALTVTGASTGNGTAELWDEWLVLQPVGRDTILSAGVTMTFVPTPSGGEEVAFRGPDALLWTIDVRHRDDTQARQIELTLARILALRG